MEIGKPEEIIEVTPVRVPDRVPANEPEPVSVPQREDEEVPA